MFLDATPDNDVGLFSEEIFRRYIAPKLLEIFCVRDTQIRLLLLEHFAHYMRCFTNEELKMEILPEVSHETRNVKVIAIQKCIRKLPSLKENIKRFCIK